MIAGVLQFLLGVLRSGRFSALVPSAVIKGMLAAIGITIILKQLPVAFGSSRGLMDIPADFHPGAVRDRRGVAGPAVRLEAHPDAPLSDGVARPGGGRGRECACGRVPAVLRRWLSPRRTS